jgi:hypothetical protein
MDIYVGQLRKYSNRLFNSSELFIIVTIDTSRIMNKLYDDKDRDTIITIKYLEDGFQTDWGLDIILRDTVPYEA